jgi:predicted RNase H-like nuclease (RuvC/YqgF family)
MPERLAATQSELENTKLQLENAKAEVDKPFVQEDELSTKSARLKELEHELDMDKSDGETLDDGLDEPEEPKRELEMER